MAEPKKPQDHQKKAEPEPSRFTFTAAGEQYTMPKITDDYITVGFVRRHRHLDEGDFLFTALELLADGDEEILAAIDAMSPHGKDWIKLQEDFQAHGAASKGE